jgi:zinc transporter ZupT
MSCTSATAGSVTTFTLSLLLGLVAALADVFGALLLVRTHWEKRYLRYFVALGAGFMLSAALLEMIPESFRPGPRCWSYAATVLSTCSSTRSPRTFISEERPLTNFSLPVPAIPS